MKLRNEEKTRTEVEAEKKMKKHRKIGGDKKI